MLLLNPRLWLWGLGTLVWVTWQKKELSYNYLSLNQWQGGTFLLQWTTKANSTYTFFDTSRMWIDHQCFSLQQCWGAMAKILFWMFQRPQLCHPNLCRPDPASVEWSLKTNTSQVAILALGSEDPPLHRPVQPPACMSEIVSVESHVPSHLYNQPTTLPCTCPGRGSWTVVMQKKKKFSSKFIPHKRSEGWSLEISLWLMGIFRPSFHHLILRPYQWS